MSYAVDVLREKVKEQIREREFAQESGNDPYARMCGHRIRDLNSAIVDLGGNPLVWEADDG